MKMLVAAILCVSVSVFSHKVSANDAIGTRKPPAKVEVMRRPAMDRCAIYGSGNAYFHCALVTASIRVHDKPARSQPSFQLTRAASKRKLSKALELASFQIAERPPVAIPVTLKPSCSNAMDACYANCKREGGAPDVCNRVCTTDWICSAQVRMNYGQFLDFQIEMSAIYGKR